MACRIKSLSSLVGILLLAPSVSAGILSKKTDVLPVSCPAADTDAAVDSQIQRYLQSSSGNSGGKFFVQGWRWHTMSLINESRRLHELAAQVQNRPFVESDVDTGDDVFTALRTFADYCVNFNLRGLHKIEKDLFFPWVRTKISAISDTKVVQAFGSVLDELERERKGIEQLGISLMKQATNVADASKGHVRANAVGEIASTAAAIAESAQSMLHREETIIVPAVARLVSESEQKSFNNKVIRTLGVFDARLHLVGMHEAVVNNNIEHKLFQETIPSIPQRLIPRWKRLLYEPRAGGIALASQR